jgi:plastocyanin
VIRRHLALAFTLFVVATSAFAVGVTNADASPGATRPKAVVKILSGAKCTPAATFCFSPSAKTVVSGTKVIFKNTTLVQHTVTRCSMPACPVTGGTGTDTGFGTASLLAGNRYAFVFKGTGTYVYYCQIHGYGVMHGTITVS